MTDNLLKNLETQLMTDEERTAYHDKIKGESYMRWLAFYYLGRREHSKSELRQKLLEKQCDVDAIEHLLIEFEREGYQSDERMTSALIKDGIGKKHGKIRIYQTLKKHGLTTILSVNGVNEWIDNHAEFFSDLIINATAEEQEEVNENYEVDWLAQAVQARVKKFGDGIPCDQKEKARQLRFLQYRGFEMGVCFDALKYDLAKLNDRY
ncbi:hypothetical protein MOMA_04070 [Moraxella macacae 0408225]|uniref:Regulatory protein RecX n=1 Tax=Moraxella macacae 0408225 TaxID=1230338 RepID=L2F9I8_9GAMM|nr:regulatory protein RecX [Moraxella macacae]ELA09550.1 hypothetical protein MOMA_04070 [Moraxella macacae 0408225]